MFAVIHLSNFFLQSVLRLEPELRSGPVALVDRELTKSPISQMTEAARRGGVVAGFTASQGLARCDNLLIRNRSLAQEESATEVLVQTAWTFSPNLESTAPGVCTIELRGLTFANIAAQRQWAAEILSTLRQFHLEAQIGFASTPGLALIAAQAGDPILLVENPVHFVQSLPVTALHPPPEVAAVLSLWGIQTIGAFLALGKDKVAERLGPPAAALFDRLNLARPLEIISPSEAFAERIEFQHEVETTEALLFVLRRMIEQLARRIDLIYLVIADLDLRLTLSSGANYERAFRIPSPTNNIQVLFRMLETHLETLRTDAPIVALELRARPGKAEQHQFGLFETTLRDPNQFAETLARLTALCGSENVGTPEVAVTHRPDVFRMVVPDFSSSAPMASDKNSPSHPPHRGMQLRRFRPALPATVEFRRQRPALIRSRAFNGAVNAAVGPFLASGDWWDQAGWAREEWDVQMADGSVGRIFRAADGCFVDGIYD